MSDAAAGTQKPVGRPVIELRHVHKWYGEFHVLKDINLAGQKGRARRRLRAVGLGQVDR